MEIAFRRTGPRRYAVEIRRSGLPDVAMDPAPGYDPLVPHDLAHFVVESELGLRCGIFGQAALGGHAGTFVREGATGEPTREASRRRRRTDRRSATLLRAGHRESAASERATYVCLHDWLARSADPARRRRAAEMAPWLEHVRSTQSPAERRALDEAVLARIRARFDELSARWAALPIGGALRVEWPEPGGRAGRGSRAGRRTA